MKRTYTWIGAKGNKFELEAECTMELVDRIVDLDGHKINMGKEVSTTANLVARVDGKIIDTCWNTSFWTIVDVKDGIKKIWGIKQVAFTDDRAEEIQRFLDSVVEDAKTEEIKEREEAKKAEEQEEIIADAKKVIEQAEKQESIMTAKEVEAWRKKYNDLHNEGGYGYIPPMICLEEYQHALSIVNQ